MGQEIYLAQLSGLLFEHSNELFADYVPLGLRVGDPGKPVQKTFAGVDVYESEVEMTLEDRPNPLRLLPTKESIVDEYAAQLVANRFVGQRCRNRRVHPAG